MITPDDKQLANGLRKGDKHCFRIIFERYGPQLLAFTRGMLHDPAAAEDVVQNVFMRLWVIRERVDPERSLRAYLLVAVRNEAFCHLRMAYHARRELAGMDFADVGDSSPGVENELTAQALERAVEQVLSRMPARRREIFDMSRRQHLSNASIASLLGLSVRTVEKHIELALRDLRAILPASAAILIATLW